MQRERQGLTIEGPLMLLRASKLYHARAVLYGRPNIRFEKTHVPPITLANPAMQLNSMVIISAGITSYRSE